MLLVLKHIILNSTFRRYLYSLPKLHYFKEDLPPCPSITNTEIKALWVSFSTCFYNSKTESSDIWLLKEFSRLRRTTVNNQCLLRDMLGTMTFFSIQMVLKLFFFFLYIRITWEDCQKFILSTSQSQIFWFEKLQQLGNLHINKSYRSSSLEEWPLVLHWIWFLKDFQWCQRD